MKFKFIFTSCIFLVVMVIIFCLFNIAWAADSDNLIANPSLEIVNQNIPTLPQGWLKGGFCTNSRVLTYPVAGYDGVSAAKAEITSYTSGDAKWYFQPVTVIGGRSYTFSDYYTSDVSSSVKVQFQLADGSYKYLDLKILPANSSWQQFQTTFVAPANAVSLTVFHAIKGVGSLTIDNYSLKLVPLPGTVTVNISVINDNGGILKISDLPIFVNGKPVINGVAKSYTVGNYQVVENTDPRYTLTFSGDCDSNGNIVLSSGENKVCNLTNDDIDYPGGSNLVPNSSLEIVTAANSSLPQAWFKGGYGTNSRVLTYPVAGYDGVSAAKAEITSYTSGDAKWYFQKVPATPGLEYSFFDYYTSTVTSTVTVQFQLADGSYKYLDLGSLPLSADWQQFQTTFVAPANAVSLTIFHAIKGVGSLTIDNYSLKSFQLPQGIVTFNFDDNWVSVYQNAFSILKQANFVATESVITETIGWEDYMTLDQLKEMNAAGIEIISHSRSHPHLTELNSSQLMDELAGSKAELLAMGFSPVNIFVYPYGEYNDIVKQAVKDTGYIGARVADEGFNDRSTDSYLLNDMHLERDVTVDQVKGWIDQAVRDKTWLILEIHDIKENGDQYSATPETFQAIVDYLVQQKVTVVTLGQGLDILQSSAN